MLAGLESEGTHKDCVLKTNEQFEIPCSVYDSGVYLYGMRILIYGLAKSGTTVLHLKIKNGMEKVSGTKVTEVFEAVRRDGDTLYKKDDTSFQIADNTLVKSLLPTVEGKGASPQSVLNDFSDFDKKIFIVRDPRDRWISAFFYRWYHVHKPNVEDYEKAHRLTQYKEAHPSDLPFYALFSTNPVRNEALKNRQLELHSGVLQFLEDAKKQDWFVIKYEDLMDGNTAALEEYLGFSIEDADPSDKRFSHVARSKNHGNWRRWFTPEDVEFYRPMFNDYLTANGYDAEDWKLQSVDHLSAHEGSAYMQKLFTGHHAHHHKKSTWKKLFGK